MNIMDNNLRNILSRLQKVKISGNQHTALCPAHDDRTASLSVALKGGKILLKSVFPVYKKEFDRNNDLFNCRNGTLNLKTFEFKNHDPNDILTKISNVHYDPEATSPLFEKFIGEVMQGDAEKTEYLQKAHGYGLTADTHYETCFILYGATKRNGKSTLTSTIMHMLGDYALDMKPETLAVKKNHDSRQATGKAIKILYGATK